MKLELALALRSQASVLVPSWVLGGAALDLDFANGRYFTPTNIPLAGLVSCSRAGSGFAETVAGTLNGFSAHAPRITDKGLLVEEARTNLALRSNAMDLSPWSAMSSLGVAASAATAPDGSVTAFALTQPTQTNTTELRQSIGSLTIGVTYVASVWVLKDSIPGATRAPHLAFGAGGISFDTMTGACNIFGAAGGGVLDCGAWWRAWVCFVATATSHNLSLQPARNRNIAEADNIAWTGNPPATATFWQADLNAGTFATSPIVTAGSTVTRPADVITGPNPNLAPPYSAVVWSGGPPSAAIAADYLNWGTVTNGGGLYQITTQAGGFVRESSATTVLITSGTLIAGTPFKIAARYAANNTNEATNGVLGTPDTSNTPPTMSTLHTGPGSLAFGGSYPSAYIRRVAIFPVALSDGQLSSYST